MPPHFRLRRDLQEFYETPEFYAAKHFCLLAARESSTEKEVVNPLHVLDGLRQVVSQHAPIQVQLFV